MSTNDLIVLRIFTGPKRSLIVQKVASLFYSFTLCKKECNLCFKVTSDLFGEVCETLRIANERFIATANAHKCTEFSSQLK